MKITAKIVTASMLALVLAFGAFGTLPVSRVHAESTESLESKSNAELRATLISLINQLLAMLKLQRSLDGTVNVRNDDSCDTSRFDDTGLTELEADIFTNETVVKIELDGDRDVFVTSADTRSEVVDAVLARYSSVSRSEVDSALSVDIEDRASRASDKNWADTTNSPCSCDDTGLHEVEADIFTNETVVKLTLNGTQRVFTTSADTRAEVITAILDRYSGLTESQVDRLLELSTEDRASRASDKTVSRSSNCSSNDDNNDDEDDDEDDDDDDDEDDGHGRNRGHGGGGDDDEDDDD